MIQINTTTGAVKIDGINYTNWDFKALVHDAIKQNDVEELKKLLPLDLNMGLVIDYARLRVLAAHYGATLCQEFLAEW
jgi:hypothetical protein